MLALRRARSADSAAPPAGIAPMNDPYSASHPGPADVDATAEATHWSNQRVFDTSLDLMLVVGTPGVGPGTFAQVGYETLIPRQAFLLVEGEFPPRQAGAPPLRERFELKERC